MQYIIFILFTLLMIIWFNTDFKKSYLHNILAKATLRQNFSPATILQSRNLLKWTSKTYISTTYTPYKFTTVHVHEWATLQKKVQHTSTKCIKCELLISAVYFWQVQKPKTLAWYIGKNNSDTRHTSSQNEQCCRFPASKSVKHQSTSIR